MSCTIAVIASASSGPLVSILIVAPTLAASSITAMMLRALAHRPFHINEMLHRNCEATLTILAHARA
jgi:hypothetical protein